MKKNVLIFSFLYSFSSWANIAVTTSGGVALGSYEAGYLYYLSEVQKMYKKKDVSHFTGASAGGINSYIAINSICNGRNEDFDKSTFWKMWVETGIEKLYIPEKTTTLSLFTRSAFQEGFSQLKENFLNGFKKDCDYILGVAITNTTPYNLKLTKNFSIKGLRDYIIIRFKGRGAGISPEVTNFILSKKIQRQVLLPFTKNGEKNFELIKKALYATSAFPVASSPVELPVCIRDVFSPIEECHLKDTVKKTFIDGGILDNSPLGLSRKISRQLVGRKQEKGYLYIYVDAANYKKPVESKMKNNLEDSKGIVATNFDYFTNFIGVSRSSELASVIENDPSIISRLLITEGNLPPVSSPMHAFFGFYDKDFRVFDFSLGMSDAKELVSQLGKKKEVKLPTKDHWILFHCIEALRGRSKSSEKICANKKEKVSKNLKIIYQVTVNRVYNDCLKSGKAKPYCEKVVKKKWLKEDYLKKVEIKQKTNETEEAYVLRLLDQYGYEFKQLKVLYPKEKTGADMVYASQKEMLETLRSKQTGPEEILIGVLKTLLLQRLEYRLPQNTLFFNFGNTLEVGHSHNSPYLSGKFIFLSSLIVQDLHSYLGSSQKNVSFVPSFGLLYFPEITKRPAFRVSFGLQLGYQLSRNDRFGSRRCGLNELNISSTYCSGAVAIPSLNISFFDRATLKLGFVNNLKKTYGKFARSGFLMIGYLFY